MKINLRNLNLMKGKKNLIFLVRLLESVFWNFWEKNQTRTFTVIIKSKKYSKGKDFIEASFTFCNTLKIFMEYRILISIIEGIIKNNNNIV